MSDDVLRGLLAKLHQLDGSYPDTFAICDPSTEQNASAQPTSRAEIESLQLISLRTTCRVLDNCSAMTVWRLRKTDPTFPQAIRLGSGISARIYFRLVDLRRWLAERETHAKAPGVATVIASGAAIGPSTSSNTALRALNDTAKSPPADSPIPRPPRRTRRRQASSDADGAP